METMQLAAGSRGCRRARRFVDRVAGDRLTPEQCFRAMLAVTELTANAMRHAGTDITLEVECLDGCVRISVCDGSPQPPVPQTAARREVGGRGLMLVGNVADDWGFTLDGDGKRVWCDVAAAGSDLARPSRGD